MIKIVDKTNPFIINLERDDIPFNIDEYYKIHDDLNNNPICRIIRSESEKNNENIIFKATAKIETSISKPINPNSIVSIPTFDDLKPYIFKTEPENGLLLGEIQGTRFNDIPEKYLKLALMYENNTLIPQTGIPFIFNHKKMFEAPHIGLFGASGSGKTVALKVIIEELMKQHFPTILLDPHLEMNFEKCKNEIPDEYKHDFSSSFEIFTIGRNIGIDFSDLNTDELINIMSFSGELSGPMTALLRTLHNTKDTFLELTKRIDILISAYDKKEQGDSLTQEEEIKYTTYHTKIPAASTLVALSWRLNALNQSNLFNNNIELIKKSIKENKICIVRGTLEQLNILSSYLIEKFYYERRHYIDSKELGLQPDYFPPFAIAMDEAHSFCPRTNEYTLSKKILKTISQEGRKYGVFEIFATQRPSILDPTVTAQLSSKFIFRLSIKEDLKSIEAETDLTQEERERLPYLNSGESYISSSIINKTLFTKIRFGITESKTNINPFDEIDKNSVLTKDEIAILKYLPFNSFNIEEILSNLKKNDNVNLTLPELTKKLEILADKGKVNIETNIMGKIYRP